MRNSPTREDLALIAGRDPCLAMALIAFGRQIQVYTAETTFESGAVNQAPMPAEFRNPVSSHIYIFSAAYDVETLQANSGSIFAGQQAHFNALQPGIDAQIMVSAGMGGGMAYNVNQSPAPIQGLARHVSTPEGGCCSWVDGWMVPWGSQVSIGHSLRRAYTQGELPVRVVWYFYAAFLGGAYKQAGSPTEDEARAFLAEQGMTVPATRIPRRG